MVSAPNYIETLQELKKLARQTRDPLVTELIGLLDVWIESTGDNIQVGDIGNSTGVAIGRNIDMTINQYMLSPKHENTLKTILGLLQNQTTALDCPQCNMADKVQKIQVIVRSSNIRSSLINKLRSPKEPHPPQKKNHSSQEYQLYLKEFLDIKYPNWKKEMTIWEKLFYCFRCDVKFTID